MNGRYSLGASVVTSVGGGKGFREQCLGAAGALWSQWCSTVERAKALELGKLGFQSLLFLI